MRFTEFKHPLQPFIGTVRVASGAGQMLTKLVLWSDGHQQARALFARLFGVGNIIAVAQLMNESATQMLKSPAELQVKAMSDQAKQLKTRAKTIRAKRALDKAKQSLQKATSNSITS